MKNAGLRTVAVCAVAMLAGAAGSVWLHAQAPAVKRTPLLRQDTTIQDREALIVLVELPAGSAEGRHTHPAELYVYVQEGTVSVEHEGKPTVSLKAGDVFSVAPGKIHQAINNSQGTAKLTAFFIAEKGKPLSVEAK